MIGLTPFDRAVLFTRREEGGFYAGDKPGDPNVTNFGITQKRYDPTGVKSVKDITPEEVAKIYHDYWIDAKCDKIVLSSPSLAICHFDCAFNAGTHQAALLLQRSVGALADGQIGPATLALITDKTEKDDAGVVITYLAHRLSFLKGLHNWPIFSKVWAGRCTRLAIFVNLPWRAT